MYGRPLTKLLVSHKQLYNNEVIVARRHRFDSLVHTLSQMGKAEEAEDLERVLVCHELQKYNFIDRCISLFVIQ